MERDNSLSYIRAIACIAIVVLHSTYAASLQYVDFISNSDNGWTRIFVNCNMWAVPTFIAVTGVLMLDPARKLTYKKLYGKYVARVLAAIVIFCIAYRLFDLCLNRSFAIEDILPGFTNIITGNTWSPMWYLYMLIGLYVMLPFYKMVIEKSNEKDIRYLLLVYIVFLSIIPMLQGFGVQISFYVHELTIYPFYLFLGYAIYHGKIRIKSTYALAIFVATTALIAVLTFLRWTGDGSLTKYYEEVWKYSSIVVILQTGSLFALACSFKKEGLAKAKKLLLSIDKCSFGIYLIHIMVIKFIYNGMNFDPYTSITALNFVFVIATATVLSYLITLVLKRIPGIKKVL